MTKKALFLNRKSKTEFYHCVSFFLLCYKFFHIKRKSAGSTQDKIPSPSNINPNWDLTGKKILILAPHQDDEALMCSGVIESALCQKINVKIGVITNGDKKGEKIGLIRLRETIKAMNYFGLDSENIVFFGFGNTNMDDSAFMNRLYNADTDTMVIPSNVGTQTYSISEKPEYHYQKYGAHGIYNKETFRKDLKAFISEYTPDLIFVSSLYDAHPDHSVLYKFTVESIINIKRENRKFSPIVYEYLIHSCDGDDLWPSRESNSDPLVPFSKPKTLDANSLLDWEKRESFCIPVTMKTVPRSKNKKYKIIGKYRSQRPSRNNKYLYSYVKSDEFFWKKDFSNIAFLANVSVSSENSETNQLGVKAIDGITDGYPRFPDNEWVTMGETAGAWIELRWDRTYKINRIILYERPNLNDNILSATLTFSDGSLLLVGNLPNNGAGYNLNFATKTVNWVKLTINEAVGLNIGLSEIEVYENCQRLY